MQVATNEQTLLKKLLGDKRVAKGVIPSGHRFRALFSPYKSIMRFHNGETALIGRGSLNAVDGIEIFMTEAVSSRHSITIGNFCQVGKGCKLLPSGDHQNDKIINVDFSDMIVLKSLLAQKGKQLHRTVAKGPIEIGSGVVFSMNSTALSGVRIGHGAVIGANAVVTKDVPPFAIVAGNPAKIIRYRFDQEKIERILAARWWDFKEHVIAENYDLISRLDDPQVQKKLQASNPRDLYDSNEENYFVFEHKQVSTTSASVQVQRVCIGVQMAGKFIPLNQLPAIFTFYVNQQEAQEGVQIFFPRDIFHYAGLA